jgi:hypothetical protein
MNPRFYEGGDIVVRFTIRSDGRPVGVDLGSGTYTEELRSCLTRIFRGMRFPEHDGTPLPVSFPFHIRAR